MAIADKRKEEAAVTANLKREIEQERLRLQLQSIKREEAQKMAEASFLGDLGSSIFKKEVAKLPPPAPPQAEPQQLKIMSDTQFKTIKKALRKK